MFSIDTSNIPSILSYARAAQIFARHRERYVEGARAHSTWNSRVVPLSLSRSAKRATHLRLEFEHKDDWPADAYRPHEDRYTAWLYSTPIARWYSSGHWEARYYDTTSTRVVLNMLLPISFWKHRGNEEYFVYNNEYHTTARSTPFIVSPQGVVLHKENSHYTKTVANRKRMAELRGEVREFLQWYDAVCAAGHTTVLGVIVNGHPVSPDLRRLPVMLSDDIGMWQSLAYTEVYDRAGFYWQSRSDALQTHAAATDPKALRRWILDKLYRQEGGRYDTRVEVPAGQRP